MENVDNSDDRTKALSDKALLCRRLGHPWAEGVLSPFVVVQRDKKRKKPEIVRQDLVCPGCDSIRFDLFWYPSFNLVNDRYHYKYSDGYLAAVAGGGRISRQAVRAEQFRRSGVR
jgi:hypothetical protein